jgi:hypothetical protein
MDKNPDVILNLGGFKTYKDYIDSELQQANCPA